MRKLLTALLSILLILPVFRVSALEKSIEELSEETSVSNAEASIIIPYGEGTARVYYGENGINLFTPEGRVVMETNYAVKKLISVGDIDKDGYVDFLTYQLVPDEVAQLMCISGLDGHVISSMRETRDDYNNALGINVVVNCFIQQMLSAEDGTAYVICDYSIIRYNMADGTELGRFTETNNIWKMIFADDINGDGFCDLAYSGQSNFAGIVDGNTMESLKRYNPSEEYTFSLAWDESKSVKAIFNMWDLRYENGILYILCEDGRLYMIDPFNSFVDENGNETASITSVDLEVLDRDAFKNLLSNRISYYSETNIQYNPAGILDWPYMGYRFADGNDQYLLINAYMGSLEGEAQWIDSQYPAKIVLYNKETGEVEARFVTENPMYKYQKTCFGVYQDQPVIAAINHIDEGSATLGLYDLEGKLLTQKVMSSSYFGYDRKMELNWDGEKYMLEVFDSGCLNISGDLKKVTSGYSSSQTEVLEIREDGILKLITTGGIKNKIARYESDGKTPVWEYVLKKNINHKGFEYIGYDADFNNDKVNDVFLIVNSYDSKDSKVYSQFIILNGTSGKVLVDKNIITATYYDENWNKITQYLTGSSLSVLKDIDWDGVKELVVDGNVVSSRRNEVVGSNQGYIETDGVPLEVGDANGDGFSDYVVITKAETRLYLSKYSYSYGVLEVSYTKTGSVFPNPAKADAMYSSIIFGDVNNDGVKEIGMVDYNSEGRQIFKVVNGKTLYTMFRLCSEGLKGNGEAFKILDADFNNDGYNELVGVEMWQQGIYDGKTGELVFRPNMYDDPYKDEYYADYLIPFTILEYMDYEIAPIGDINGDNCQDFAYIDRYDNDNFQWVCSIRSVSGSNWQKTGEVIISINDYEEGYGKLIGVTGKDGLVALSNENKKTTRIFDLTKNREIMGYSINVTGMSVGKDDQLLGLKDKKLYALDTKPSFTLNREIPSFSENNTIHLGWNNVQDYSVMTVYDNGNVVYKGSDNECDIKLLEGNHNIRMSMNDGQGKIYSETCDIEIAQQPKSYVVAAVIAAISLILSILLGIFQKIRINRKFRKGAGK